MCKIKDKNGNSVQKVFEKNDKGQYELKSREVFNKNDVGFISIRERFDTTTPFGKAMIGILSVFAQLERETIIERTRIGLKKRAEDGYWRGGGKVPFAYKYVKDTGTLVIDE